jgi:hypothetical protein
MKATCNIRMVDERDNLIVRSAFEVAVLLFISSDAQRSLGERLTASPRSTLSNALCLIGGGVIAVAPWLGLGCQRALCTFLLLSHTFLPFINDYLSSNDSRMIASTTVSDSRVFLHAHNINAELRYGLRHSQRGVEDISAIEYAQPSDTGMM